MEMGQSEIDHGPGNCYPALPARHRHRPDMAHYRKNVPPRPTLDLEYPKLSPPPFSPPNGMKFNQPNLKDAVEFLRDLPQESVGAAFFDPQYAPAADKVFFHKAGGPKWGWGRAEPPPEIPEMGPETIREVVHLIERILVPGGHLFIWTDKRHVMQGEIENWVSGKKGCQIRDMMIWDKVRLGLGHKTRYTMEFLMIAQKVVAGRAREWQERDMPDIWRERKSNKVHPHAKPIGLQTNLIRAATSPDEVVIDPCAGTYSVLEACRMAGRNFLGGDLFGDLYSVR